MLAWHTLYWLYHYHSSGASFLSMAGYHSILYTYHIPFAHSSVGWHFWLFLLWGYYEPCFYEHSCSNLVWIHILGFLGYRSKSRIVASYRDARPFQSSCTISSLSVFSELFSSLYKFCNILDLRALSTFYCISHLLFPFIMKRLNINALSYLSLIHHSAFSFSSLLLEFVPNILPKHLLWRSSLTVLLPGD